MNVVDRLLRDRRASTAAEFGLVLPLLLLLIFGVIDAGRLLYNVNQAEKATQMGARYAIVTDVIPAALVSFDYVGTTYCTNATSTPCVAGDAIDQTAALGTLRCTSTACNCTGTCPSGASIDAAAFTNLVTRMQAMMPQIVAANVVVSFRGSGLGYAGDPNGMEIVPLVTVELQSLQFTPITALALTTFTLPAFQTTLSAESAVGTQSN